MSNIERRRHLRRYVHAYIRCSDGKTEFLAAGLNISRSGMQLNVSSAADASSLIVAKPVRVSLRPDTVLEGRIVGSARSPREGRSGLDLGVEFTDPLPEDRVIEWAQANSRHPANINTIIRDSDSRSLRMRVLAEFGNSRPLSNLMRRLTASPRRCNCIVVEKDYDDREVEDLFDGYNHRHFRANELPIRLHFFTISEAEAVEPIVYHGFTTLRRLHLSNNGIRLGHVGRTVVSFPEADEERRLCGISAAGDNYVVIGTSYKAVANASLQEVESFEYRQQSFVGGTCAHAGVHCVSGFLRRLIGTRALSGNDVLAAAQTLHSSGKLVDGLIEDHIAKAVAATGCNVRAYYLENHGWGGSATFTPRKALKFRSMMEILHTAIDSQMPAILVMASNQEGERHAVVAVGHTATRSGPPFHPIKEVPRAGDSGLVRTTTDWVHDVLVHDDNVGPFLRLPVFNRDTYKRVEVAEHEDDSEARYDALWERSLEKHLYSIIVPFPDGVNLCPSLVPAFLRQVLSVGDLSMMSGHLRTGGRYFKEIQEAAARGELVISTYLDLSNRFRVRTIEQLKALPGGSALEATILTHLSLPKYVYIASVTTLDRVVKDGTFGAEILGYIIVDSSATRFSDDAVLATRLGELIIYLGPGGMKTNKEIEYHPRKQGIAPD